jgi:hypothetical protein
MAKPILNEQFKRMHKIAGLLTEESMKSTTKTTKKILTAQIKEMILAEMNVDMSDDDKFYDFLTEMDPSEFDDESDIEQNYYRKSSALEGTTEYDTELGEAKKKSKKDEEAPEEIDAELDTEVDTEIPIDTPEPTNTDVQKELTDALEAAKASGDEKLVRQIGNALTYFTRSQVAGEEGNMGGLNESFVKKMQRTAGIIK